MNQRSGLAFLILVVVIAITAGVFITDNLAISKSAPIMPLDDAYIHFQYARAIAEGYPLHYNPDQPATSGGTSFLYPAILAIGYKIGFADERLAWWALGIGVLSWLGSAWLVYLLSAREKTITAHWIGLFVAIAFVLSGPLIWAFLSGMETGLMILFTLLTLWYVVRNDWRGTIVAGVLVTLIRPEGVIIGGLAALTMISREYSLRQFRFHGLGYLFIPAAAVIQPMINLFATGAITASGLQAKSYLYNIPPRGIVDSIVSVAVRMMTELFTGNSPTDGLYYLPVLSAFAMLTLIFGVWLTARIRFPSVETMVLGWFVGLILIISTLETAFWQFKRYQMPLVALLFPLAAWGLLIIWVLLRRFGEIIVAPLLMVLVFGSLVTTVSFRTNYADNVREIATSQLPMARYVAENVPPDAIIGVHDIGVMRYFGQHDTYDLVGLTTATAAPAGRNGPGSMYEQMLTSPYRPSYFAIYRDARGLTYLADTDLYKDKLASFPSSYPTHNVASATDTGQAVYKADWTSANAADQPMQPSTLTAIHGLTLVDQVNVANLASESAHSYRWWEAAQQPGFASEVYELTYVACQPTLANPSCRVMDGGRLITGGEEMTITTIPNQDLIWVTRVHPYNATTLHLFVNNLLIATRVIPSIPGQWLEVATLIPASAITGTSTAIRAEANITDPTAGHYMPYYHWFYQGHFQPITTLTLTEGGATFGKSIQLLGRSLAYDPDSHTVSVDLEWQIDPAHDPTQIDDLGDKKLFIHIIDANNQIATQLDQRPGQGALPPANWLPGILHDHYTLSLPTDAPSGDYRAAIGLYDPNTNQRMPISGGNSDSANRLFIGTITVARQ